MSVVRCARLLPSPKSAALLLDRSYWTIHRGPGAVRLLPAIARMHQPLLIHTISEHRGAAVQTSLQPKIGFIEKMLKKVGFLDMQKYRSMHLGYMVYEHVLNQVDYSFFFKYFNMQDTFFSWFLVTELHVWMIMLRYMGAENYGKVVRNYAVMAMWDDTKARVDKLGTIRSKLKNEQIQEISYQFNAAIIGYDEGIQSDDKTLAGALWRRFFVLECNNPEHIETLVLYVRKQICLFDSLSNQDIFRTKPVLNLIDIKTLCKHQQ